MFRKKKEKKNSFLFTDQLDLCLCPRHRIVVCATQCIWCDRSVGQWLHWSLRSVKIQFLFCLKFGEKNLKKTKSYRSFVGGRWASAS